MSKEFFEAVKMLESEKGISADYLYEKIAAAIVVAAKHEFNGKDIVHCDIDPEKEKIKVYAQKNVVEEIEDPDTDLTLEQAQLIRKSAKIGKTVDIPIKQKIWAELLRRLQSMLSARVSGRQSAASRWLSSRAKLRNLLPQRLTV